jgi:hypothetical protein
MVASTCPQHIQQRFSPFLATVALDYDVIIASRCERNQCGLAD